jgi:hypothetical protein
LVQNLGDKKKETKEIGLWREDSIPNWHQLWTSETRQKKLNAGVLYENYINLACSKSGLEGHFSW